MEGLKSLAIKLCKTSGVAVRIPGLCSLGCDWHGVTDGQVAID